MINTYLFFDPKDFKKAEKNGLKAVKLAPSSPGIEIALGDCYRVEKELEKARDCNSKAIILDPNSPDAYYKKGNASTFLRNLDEARQNFMDGGKYDKSTQEEFHSSPILIFMQVSRRQPINVIWMPSQN